MHPPRRILCSAIWAWLAFTLWLPGEAGTTLTATAATQSRRMSFHNRLLLNRAVVSRLRTLEVMLVAGDHGVAPAAALVERIGGRVERTFGAVGYLRVDVPTDKLLELVASPDIEAYQIASLSKASWYRDGPPQANAELHRGFEISTPLSVPPAAIDPRLPLLSPEASRDAGFTADDDVGVGEWIERHPTFDGRGVTIALVENGLPSFTDPGLRGAKTLDGRDVPKLAGILNTIDPDEPDETRVSLSSEVDAAASWSRIGARTYILPRPGRYRFGLFNLPAGTNLVHQFGVLEDESTHEVWVDTNGNSDFQDETPVADVNERFDVRVLKLTHPRPTDLGFVMARGRAPHSVHLYVAVGSHQTMTFSVAAGSRTDESLAYGVAPNARVLLVRTRTPEYRLVDIVEGYLEAAARPDVDLFSDSSGIDLVPDTAADFAGLLFSRLSAVYGKPFFHAAGNMHLFLNSATALGVGFSVGGSLGARTFAALAGGGTLDGLLVHPLSAAGPSLDGAIAPDFLAPMHRIAADLPGGNRVAALPKNAAAARLPSGYQISCCTSASSPYAAGVAALLLSAAKQQRAPYSVDSLGRALRIASHFISGWPASQQGNGVLDVNAAWRELVAGVDAPRIRSFAGVVHPLAQYAARGGEGQGIFEFGVWTTGMTGSRELRLRRESGPREPVTYRVSWTGNDDTFTTARSVTLPLNVTVAVPVTIVVRSPGAHDALLNLHDPATDAIIFRSQATVVAPERPSAASGSVRMTGRVPLMRVKAHYVQVPRGVATMSIELEVIRGTIRAAILPSHGLFPNYYQHLYPGNTRQFARGKYTVVLPYPAEGPWTISLNNDSAWLERNPALVAADQAEYAITVRLLTASVRTSASRKDTVAIDVESPASDLREPVLETSIGMLRSHAAAFLSTGLPNVFEIAVPEGAATLWLQLRADAPSSNLVEMYLYDCTSGQCFSHDLAFPAATAQALVVRRPKSGRWVVAVNAAPFPAATGGFVLEEIIATDVPHRSPVAARPGSAGRYRRETITVDLAPPAAPGKTRILFVELIDLATERDEAEHPWDHRPGVPRLTGRPAAGTAICRIE
jgi:Subtilase family